MSEYWIVCRSFPQAKKAQSLLAQAGLQAQVVRAPGGISPRGCGYCLRLQEGQLTAALPVLHRGDVGPLSVYVGSYARGFTEVSP